jgi:hypothetical protein
MTVQPVIETAEAATTEEAASVLPQEGEVVCVHYFVDPAFKHEIYDCRVEGVKEKSLFGPMILVKPVLTEAQTAKFGALAPRWVTLHQLAKPEAPATTQKALTEDELKAEMDRLLPLISPAFQAWSDALMHRYSPEIVAKLDQAHEALQKAYEDARKAYIACRRKEAVTPAAPTPAPVSALPVHGEERTGRVSSYDAEAQYGYILSRGESFYFQTRHLQHAVAAGDTVTFLVWYMTAGAKPRATRISKPGYVAPKNPAVERAQEEARKNAEREARRKANLEAGRANRQSALKAQGA